jgi:glycosyltransferase involved in cell wall biosynthesis
MARAEKTAFETFETILVSSPVDRYIDHPKVRLVRSPHALADSPPSSVEVGLPPRSLLFVGRLSYGANIDAVERFVLRVLPQLRKRVEGLTVHLVGDAPDRRLVRLAADNADVSLVGRVPDVEPYYRTASVSIVPVEAATGVQMKLIEALWCGTPTVASAVVAKSAGGVGDACLVAESDEEWVDRIVDILHDESKAQQLSKAGREWAQRLYSFETIKGALYDALDLQTVSP